uniref:Uncharacterized protein n=1 Tax=Anguilla anguilla TaxID=7936 RepID=A0A0E9VQR5_ANGAN
MDAHLTSYILLPLKYTAACFHVKAGGLA